MYQPEHGIYIKNTIPTIILKKYYFSNIHHFIY